jgi:hypothetical protein
MAYRDFSWDLLEEQFSITNELINLFPTVRPVHPSEYVQTAIQIARGLPLRNEKAKSELIVSPILADLVSRNADFFTLFSGETINADRERGLVGEVDFLIAKRTRTINLNFPILAIIEAKKNDFDLGRPQCAAQLLGAQRVNARRGHDVPLYGCVTTATDWQFFRLENNHFQFDERTWHLDQLADLLGVLQHILDEYKELLTEQGFMAEEPALPYGALWL